MPVFGAVGGIASIVGKHHKGRQIIVETAESVADPATHAWKSRELESGGLQISGLTMHTGLADQVVNKGHVVNAGTERSDRFADCFATFTVAIKAERRLHPRAETILKDLDWFTEVRRFTMSLFKLGFVIPEIDMTGGTRHEQLDDSCGLGRMMKLGQLGTRADLRFAGTEQAFLSQKACKS